MQRIVRDEGAVVIPMFAEVVVAASDKLKHDNFASNSNLDGLKCSERWWFES
jgi:peptide/nickel transport system substrate-binding protein